MALPNDTKITVKSDGDFDFPSRTVLMKNFRLANQLIETRLFMKHPDGVWAGYTYKWNTAQTQATLVTGGTTAVYSGQTWVYPSEGQCLQCHTSAAGNSLGLEIPQLNGNTTYPQTGRTANQIYTLNALGMFTPAQTQDISAQPRYRKPDGAGGTIAQRARAYLHTNCSQCHRPNGGTTVSMDLRYSVAIGSSSTCNVAPSSGDLGVTGAKRIVPGDATHSMIYLRMNRRGANQMPPIASNVVDADGAALIADWINQMSPACD
jgi:uncharacterized repeat protein (TIGR03806 family)